MFRSRNFSHQLLPLAASATLFTSPPRVARVTTSEITGIRVTELSGAPRTVTLWADVNPISATVVVNGAFDTDAVWAGWDANWVWNAVTQKADRTAAATTLLGQDVGAAAGYVYTITYTVTNYGGAGDITVGVGGALGTARAANGTYVEDVTAAGAGNLLFSPSALFAGTIDNVSATLHTQAQAILNALPLLANQTRVFDVSIPLRADATVWGKGSLLNAVNIRLDGQTLEGSTLMIEPLFQARIHDAAALAPAATQLLYTVPAIPSYPSSVTILGGTICNTTAGAATISVYFVPSGGVAGDANAVLKGYSIAAHETAPFSFGREGGALTGNMTIEAVSDTDLALTFTCGGALNV